MAVAAGKAWIDTISEVRQRFGEFVLPAAAFVFLPSIVAARFAGIDRLGERGAMIAQVLIGLIGVLSTAAIIWMVFDPRLDAGSAIRRGTSSAPRIILASLAPLLAFAPVGYLYALQGDKPGLVVAIGMLVLAFAALYVAVRLSLFSASIIAENASAQESLKRSWSLTAGTASSILLIYAAFFLAFILTSAIAGAIGMIATGGTPGDPSFATAFLLSAIGAVFNIYIAVAGFHIYRQLAH